VGGHNGGILSDNLFCIFFNALCCAVQIKRYWIFQWRIPTSGVVCLFMHFDVLQFEEEAVNKLYL
jgi:hypothetical protein